MNVVRSALQVVIFIAVVGVGVGSCLALRATRPEAAREEQSILPTLVEVLRVESQSHELKVRASGTVVPSQSIALIPEVGGRIIWQSEELVPGGRFTEGQPILRIDPRDYQTALQQSGAELQRARLDEEIEAGRQVVAAREWELFGDTETDDASEARALRQPQLENAAVAVQAARSGVRRARVNLRRTTVRAPFDLYVREESADLGMLVGPTTRLGTLVGSDSFWVQVSVPVSNLERIDVPGFNAEAGHGSVARVWQETGAGRVERQGQVVRLFTDLDPVGLMARVLVEIPDPLGMESESLPLLLGSFVRVEIDVRSNEEMIEIPREALREDNRLFVMNADNQLSIRQAEVGWRRDQTVLVTSGVEAGERIVTSPLRTPVDGMALRVAEEEDAVLGSSPTAATAEGAATRASR
ncbi:MAG: efflux RND transporter periplasmic adaptor subunit [Myxococcota bacterium]